MFLLELHIGQQKKTVVYRVFLMFESMQFQVWNMDSAKNEQVVLFRGVNVEVNKIERIDFTV